MEWEVQRADSGRHRTIFGSGVFHTLIFCPVWLTSIRVPGWLQWSKWSHSDVLKPWGDKSMFCYLPLNMHPHLDQHLSVFHVWGKPKSRDFYCCHTWSLLGSMATAKKEKLFLNSFRTSVVRNKIGFLLGEGGSEKRTERICYSHFNEKNYRCQGEDFLKILRLVSEFKIQDAKQTEHISVITRLCFCS